MNKELKESIKTLKHDCEQETFLQAIAASVKDITNVLTAIKEQEWRKVEDELPNNHLMNQPNVLILSEGKPYVGFHGSDGLWYDYNGEGRTVEEYIIENVTHWKPISPPEGEKP